MDDYEEEEEEEEEDEKEVEGPFTGPFWPEAERTWVEGPGGGR